MNVFIGLSVSCDYDKVDFVVDCSKSVCNGQCIPLVKKCSDHPEYVPICDKDCSAIVKQCKDEFGSLCDIYWGFMFGTLGLMMLSYSMAECTKCNRI